MTLLVWPPTPQQKLGAVVIGGLVVIVVVWLWISAGQREARDLAIAEERDKSAKVLEAQNRSNDEQRRKDEEQRRIEREQTDKLIQANAELTSKLVATVAQRNQEAAQLRAALLAPKAPAQVVEDSKKHLGFEPQVQPDNSFRLTQEQFQQMIAMKADVERLTANYSDLERQFRLSQNTVTRLLTEKQGYEISLKDRDASIRERDVLITAQRDVIESYKKVAKKSKLRKVAETSGKIGMMIFAGYIGSQLGSAR